MLSSSARLGFVVPNFLDEPVGVLATDKHVDGLLGSGSTHDGEDEHARDLRSLRLPLADPRTDFEPIRLGEPVRVPER